MDAKKTERFVQALDQIGKMSAILVQRENSTEEEILCVAMALLTSAETIFVQLGGARMAAAQLYHRADFFAGKVQFDA